MKTDLSVKELASRIMAETQQKKDYVADTRKLEMAEDGRLRFKELMEGNHLAGKSFTPTKLCMEQIGNRVGIPAKYLERMRSEAPALLARNVNHWFAANPEKRMLRTYHNGDMVARAFLSDRYRPLDNYDLANVILPKLQRAGCNVESAAITEKRLYLQAVTPKLEAVIKARKSEAPGEHRVNAINDVVQAGIVISNSEVGCGAIKVEPMIFRLVCRNGLILPTALRRHHVGRAGMGEIDGQEDSFELYSDATRQLDDKAFWAKVCDVVDASLTELKFKEAVAKIEDKASGSLGSPVAVVEKTAKRFDLDDKEQASVLEHLCSGGDLSQWGLVNAITRTAEDVASYDRAIELERLGGVVLELPATDWKN